MGWKYPFAVLVVAFAAFPLAYVLSAAFSTSNSLVAMRGLFTSFSLDNFVEVGGTKFWTWMANTLIIGLSTAAGTVLSIDAAGVQVATGDGAVVIREIQAAGRKRMTAQQFAAGRGIAVGDVLGTPTVE